MLKQTQGEAKPEYPYTNRLLQAVREAKLVCGESTTGDWLAVLSKAELSELTQMVAEFDTQASAKTTDIVNLLIHLVILETDESRLELKAADLVEYLEGLRVLCHLEVLLRQGLLEVAGEKRLVGDQTDDTLRLQLTLEGRRAVQYPNADPLLQAVLKAGGNPLWN